MLSGNIILRSLNNCLDWMWDDGFFAHQADFLQLHTMSALAMRHSSLSALINDQLFGVCLCVKLVDQALLKDRIEFR